MDERRFDRWTRQFAASSRRDALRLAVMGLTAGAMAISGGRASAQVEAEACGKKGDRCRNNGDCCDRFRCKNDTCRDKKNGGSGGGGKCKRDGERCDRSADCCNQLECRNTTCRKGDGDDCGRQGDRCRRNGDCCNNFRCKNEKCRSKK